MVIKNSKQKKGLDQMASLVNTTSNKKELTPILLKLLTNEGILPSLCYKDSIPLIPKLDKDTIRKESYKPIALMRIDA